MSATLAAEPKELVTSAAAVTATTTIMSEAEVAAMSDGHTHCLVCYSDLTIRGKAPCQHDDICGVCHLRLRYLHEDKKCPICKTTNEKIIVDTGLKKFDEYPMWGDEDIGGDFFHRHDVGMFFEKTYYDTTILPLFGYSCYSCQEFNSDNEIATTTTTPGKKTTPLRALQEHLKGKHKLALCTLCVDHKRDFVSQLPRMTNNEIQNHLRHGDGAGSGFNGHPVCEFCKPKRFYDLAYLHQHLHKEHYECHVCKKIGLENQFFKNYSSLEKHFDQQHFLCHDVQCLAARFVVFENEMDIRAHELSVHGGTSTGSTKINLEFRTRRTGFDGSGVDDQQYQAAPNASDFNYGLDGQAFVPTALPMTAGSNAGANVGLHPLHIQRTSELRAHAAAIRQQQSIVSEEESFPTLQSSNAGPSSAPLVGWTSGATMQRLNANRGASGKVTTEDFPSLPTSSSAQANARKKAIRGNINANNNLGGMQRQLAAMSATATPSQPSWGGATASAPRPATSMSSGPSYAPSFTNNNNQANLSADNFPSLGPSTNARASYTAANALGRKNMASNLTADNFPSLGGGAAPAPYTAARKNNNNTAPQPAKAPPINSASDFPSLGSSAANTAQKGVRQKILGADAPAKKQSSHQAMSNVLNANMASAATAKATVEEMKASLGPNKFKQLKQYTKQFASREMTPEGYVDQSAALFDQGYGDADFWSFLPSLLESCPNEDGADRALNYMAGLRRQHMGGGLGGATTMRTTAVAAAPSGGGWGGGGAQPSQRVMQAPPAMHHPATAASRITQPYATGRAAAAPMMVPSKKKGAWGSGGNVSVVRAKAAPGSVGAAAASQGPQGGTATKFMAQQQKKQTQQKLAQPATASANQKSGGKKNNNKKKQKDELRALAFGN